MAVQGVPEVSPAPAHESFLLLSTGYRPSMVSRRIGLPGGIRSGNGATPVTSTGGNG